MVIYISLTKQFFTPRKDMKQQQMLLHEKRLFRAFILRGLFDETTQLADLALLKGVRSELMNLIVDGQIDTACDLSHKTSNMTFCRSILIFN